MNVLNYPGFPGLFVSVLYAGALRYFIHFFVLFCLVFKWIYLKFDLIVNIGVQVSSMSCLSACC